MFEWMSMIGNYESRKVDNFENDLFCIDTAKVTDRELDYETAISHKEFNCGNWIILGWSATKELAQEYHNEMVHKFTTDPSIDSITDAFTNIVYLRGEN